MSIESKFKEIKERVDGATAGPWKYDSEGDLIAPKIKPLISHNVGIVAGSSDVVMRTEDEDFISHARQDVPMLLEMVEALYAMIKCNHENTEEMLWIKSRLHQIVEKYEA